MGLPCYGWIYILFNRPTFFEKLELTCQFILDFKRDSSILCSKILSRFFNHRKKLKMSAKKKSMCQSVKGLTHLKIFKFHDSFKKYIFGNSFKKETISYTLKGFFETDSDFLKLSLNFFFNVPYLLKKMHQRNLKSLCC